MIEFSKMMHYLTEEEAINHLLDYGLLSTSRRTNHKNGICRDVFPMPFKIDIGKRCKDEVQIAYLNHRTNKYDWNFAADIVLKHCDSFSYRVIQRMITIAKYSEISKQKITELRRVLNGKAKKYNERKNKTDLI